LHPPAVEHARRTKKKGSPQAALLSLNDPLLSRWLLPHRRLLGALGSAPKDGVQILSALAEKDQRFLEDHDWWHALLKLGSAEAIEALLDAVGRPVPAGGRNGMDTFYLGREMASLALQRSGIRKLLHERYRKASGGRVLGVLETALREIPDVEMVKTMIGQYIAHTRPFDGNLRHAVEQVQPVTLITYFIFAILGGLWFPLTGFLGKVGQFTPTYEAVKIGADVIRGIAVPAGLAIGLEVWLGIFIALATAAVRSTAESV
jgi:hypothetical protein